MTEGLYLYGFVPAGAAAPSESLRGVGEGVVELVDLGACQAAVSRVPADVYSPDALEPRLSDLAWVAEQGVAHERVVAWFVDHGQILPVRLFTLYSSPDALRQEAGARAAQLERELERLEGLREWDLKISYRAETLAEHAGEVSEAVRDLDRQIAEAQPGRRFLLEKKRADLVRTVVGDAARRLAAELLDAVRPDAVEVRLVPLPQAAAALPVVLAAALLIRQDREERLQSEIAARAARLDGLGVHVQFSGPWAPYRFLAA